MWTEGGEARPKGWPAGRPRVLVADSWLANAGDGAISIATERSIRRIVPGASILHAAYQADLVGARYPELSFVPPLAALTGVAPGLPEEGGWSTTEMAELLAAADVVLSQGGGFLIEYYRPWQRLDAYEKVLELGLPLGFIAQTIGPFTDPRRRASLARTFEAAVVIGVRDRSSIGNVVDLGVPPERVRLGADEVFGLATPPPAGSPRGVACVLSGHALRGDRDFVGEEPGVVDALAEVLEATAEAADPEPVTLLSTTQGLGPFARGLEDDDEFADRVVDRAGPAGRRLCRRRRGYVDPLHCADLIAHHRAVVSMRMHPMIFGLSRGVPVVPLTRAQKAVDLIDELAIDGLSPVWLDAERIREAVVAALAPTALRGAELVERLEPMRRRAVVNDELLAELLTAFADL